MGKPCAKVWRLVSTQFGYCLNFQPKIMNLTDEMDQYESSLRWVLYINLKKYKNVFYTFRKLSFVVDYNQADAFAGHNQFFEGLTLFHASADEKTLG